jgi:hypothetical protein
MLLLLKRGHSVESIEMKMHRLGLHVVEGSKKTVPSTTSVEIPREMVDSLLSRFISHNAKPISSVCGR